MRKLSAVGLFTLLVFCSTRQAEATQFTLQSYTLAMHTANPGGLALFAQNLLTAPASFNLTTVGQSYTLNRLFQIGTREPVVNLDDLRPRPIGVSLAFSQPLPVFGGTATGISGAVNFLGGLGYVAWANPLTLAFGTNGLLQVSLTHVLFSVPGSAIVGATFTLVRQDTGGSPARVPEPATVLFLGVGALGLAAKQWRQRGARRVS